MSSTTAYKVHVKLGPAEFQAEGPEELVKNDLANFYIAATQPLASHVSGSNGNGSKGNGHANGNGQANGNGRHGDGMSLADASVDLSLRTRVDPAIISRLFKEENGVITLRVLPKSEQRNAESLLLILWGYYVLKNQLEVPSKELLAAMRGSGIASLQRVDETAEKKDYRACFTTGGSGKGKRFGLSNSGIEIAEQTAQDVFS